LRQWWRRTTQRQLVVDAVEQGPVLDVGCGFGDALLEWRERGFEVRGIESSRAGVRVCRERGLDVIEGTVEDAQLPDGHFRTIVMSHVLEHIAAPAAILRKLRAALAPGGRLVIAVPNHRGAVARVFGSAWHGWDPPYHLTHFDAHTLASMLEAAGFRVTSVVSRATPDDVTRSMAKALGRPVTALWLRVALLPGSLLLGNLALGGEICVVAERADDA
jgi:2-polyprenyl-3-methyl-5-hydroxy-6-metoxy-1,4-benzoquinol methylase